MNKLLLFPFFSVFTRFHSFILIQHSPEVMIASNPTLMLCIAASSSLLMYFPKFPRLIAPTAASSNFFKRLKTRITRSALPKALGDLWSRVRTLSNTMSSVAPRESSKNRSDWYRKVAPECSSSVVNSFFFTVLRS